MHKFLSADHHDGSYGYWAARLRNLLVKVVFILGIQNKVADGLSRTIFCRDGCADDERVLTLKSDF